MRSRVPARKPRATRRREALADASPEPSFALGAHSHRSNRENVNKRRIATLCARAAAPIEAGLPRNQHPYGANRLVDHLERAGFIGRSA